MPGSVSSTSLILCAEAEALGSMTKIMASMMKENMICMTYCMTAIMLPTLALAVVPAR